MRPPWMRTKRIFIIPTGHGLIFIGILLVMILTAASAGNNLVYILGFTLFAIYMLAMLHTHYNLKAIAWELGGLEDAFAGEPVRLTLKITNESGRDRFAYKVRTTDRKLSGKSSHLPAVGPSGRETLEVWVKADQRGEFQLPRLTVSTVYPMGLFYAWSYLEFEGKYCVYPVRMGEQSLQRSKAGEGDGRHCDTRLNEQNEDFQEHRRYQTGESYHRVDWKAYARSGDLLTKSYQDSVPEFYSLKWRDVSHLAVEARLSQLSLWIDQLHRRGVSFDLELPGTALKRGRGPQHAEACLRELARFSGEAA